LLWKGFHATFLPFRTAYGLHLQVILMRVVWQSYRMLFPQQFYIQWRKGVNFSSIAGNSKMFSCLQIDAILEGLSCKLILDMSWSLEAKFCHNKATLDWTDPQWVLFSRFAT
jgi:hypothetical protein